MTILISNRPQNKDYNHDIFHSDKERTHQKKIKIQNLREFPGNPVIKTQHFYCHGQDSSSMTKKKKKSVVIRRASKYMMQNLTKLKAKYPNP